MVPGIPIERPHSGDAAWHVALAVPDLDTAIAFSKTFGLVVSETVISHEQGVEWLMLILGMPNWS